ncbi:MAG: hypothetical protein AAFP85_15470 [Pseudomonadota bacterium]
MPLVPNGKGGGSDAADFLRVEPSVGHSKRIVKAHDNTVAYVRRCNTFLPVSTVAFSDSCHPVVRAIVVDLYANMAAILNDVEVWGLPRLKAHPDFGFAKVRPPVVVHAFLHPSYEEDGTTNH